MKKYANPLIVALDSLEEEEARQLVATLGDRAGFYKVGPDLFLPVGRDFVDFLSGSGKKVFLDLKFHDIPNTVERASRRAARMGVEVFDVHASGGRDMIRAAVEGAEGKARVVAVTVLTSLDDRALADIGIGRGALDQTLHLAEIALAAGADGVVASPREARALREAFGDDFLIITPGIRPAGASKGDQVRTSTPAEAIAAGSDLLVVGRPVVEAEDPRRAAEEILKEAGV